MNNKESFIYWCENESISKLEKSLFEMQQLLDDAPFCGNTLKEMEWQLETLEEILQERIEG